MIELFDFCTVLLDERVYVLIGKHTKRLVFKNPEGIYIVSEQEYFDLLDFDNPERTVKNIKAELVSLY